MAPIRLSPTNLSRWFTLGCPAAWDFSYNYSPVEKNEFAEFGTHVHTIIEKTDLDFTPTKAEVQAAGKLWAYANQLGLHDFDPPIAEIKQEWKLAPGVVFVRKIDRIMSNAGGEPVIVDWKTHAGYGWKRKPGEGMSIITPQSIGTQTPGYFLPPPKKVLEESGLTRWPTAMYYIVSPARGPAQAFYEERNDESDQNFQTLLKLALEGIRTSQKEGFPKNYGKQCFECEFFALCFQTPGYAEQYVQYR